MGRLSPAVRGRPRKLPPPPIVQAPACFDSLGQFKAWQDAARYSSSSISRLGPCAHCRDCTPGFQRRMQAAARCEHPEIAFGIDRDGFIAGFEPSKETR